MTDAKDSTEVVVTNARQYLREKKTQDATHVVVTVVDEGDDLAEKINAEHELAQQCAETAVQHAVRCGQLLLEVKAGLKHGEFMPWIEANCDFEQSTATRYMKAAKQIATGVAISSLSGLFPSGSTAARQEKRTPSEPEIHIVGNGAEAKFALMASQAEDLAVYRAKEVTPAVLELARRTASKWNNLTKQLEAKARAETPEEEVVGEEEVVVEPRRSRPKRWADAAQQAINALEELVGLQEEYGAWRESLPENQSDSATAEKLDAVIEIDIQGAIDTVTEFLDADLPRGFGRD